MGIVNSTKTITPSSIACNQTAQIVLALTAAPNITENPVDIMLVLDRSGSMAGTPLAELKVATTAFIDIIKNATNPGNPGATTIGTPSRIGIVSFSDTATVDVPLTNDVATLNAAVAALSAGGSTNHSDAFTVAQNNFIPVLNPPNSKILIMFTDGVTTTGGNASPAAAAARAAGIEIYCIGLGNGIDVAALDDWATDPDQTHVLVAPTPADLLQAFQDLAANINAPGATGITVVDTLEDDFVIVGTPVLVNPATTAASYSIDPTQKIITWTLDELGVSPPTEGATLTFNVQYTGCSSTTSPVNKSVVYTDQTPNQVTFTQNPATIAVNCTIPVTPDCCYPPVDVPFSSCQTVVDLDLPSATDSYDLKCDGRLLILGVRLKNICPNRRIAVGVIVTEVLNGVELSRGFKAVTVPAQTNSLPCPCRELLVKPITFVLPEDLDNTPDVCDARDFRVRVIAHYIDIGLRTFNVCPVIQP